jgi:hypothetical protein
MSPANRSALNFLGYPHVLRINPFGLDKPGGVQYWRIASGRTQIARSSPVALRETNPAINDPSRRFVYLTSLPKGHCQRTCPATHCKAPLIDPRDPPMQNKGPQLGQRPHIGDECDLGSHSAGPIKFGFRSAPGCPHRNGFSRGCPFAARSNLETAKPCLVPHPSVKSRRGRRRCIRGYLKEHG